MAIFLAIFNWKFTSSCIFTLLLLLTPWYGEFGSWNLYIGNQTAGDSTREWILLRPLSLGPPCSIMVLNYGPCLCFENIVFSNITRANCYQLFPYTLFGLDYLSRTPQHSHNNLWEFSTLSSCRRSSYLQLCCLRHLSLLHYPRSYSGLLLGKS